jgi:hypothetical protein
VWANRDRFGKGRFRRGIEGVMATSHSRSLAPFAFAQYGLVTEEQALQHMSRREFERRVRDGQLERVRPTVYRCEGAPPSWQQDLFAVCLRLGPPAVASHRSAARLWRLDAVGSEKLEITVPRGKSARMAGVIVHHEALLPSDMTHRFRIPVTSAVMTIIHLAAVVGAHVLELALDDALRQHHLTVIQIDRRLRMLGGRGRPQPTVLRRLIDERGPGYVPGESHWEDCIYRWIVAAGHPAPVRQYTVILNGQRRRIDLAYPDLKIAIEFDGWDRHQMRRRFDDDRARTIDLQLAGWLVLVFTSRSSQIEVVEKVGQARAQRLSTMV